MKKLILIVAALLLAASCATTPRTGDEGRTYSVYEYPDAKDKGTLPVYRVKEMPNGEVRVYEYGNPFEPKYIIRGNEAYKPGNPFQPVAKTKEKGGK